MNKIKGILITGLLLLSILTIIAPVSAGTIHVYPGDDIYTKLNSAVSGDTVYVHAGTYPLSQDVYYDGISVTIIGDDASNTIITSAGTQIYGHTAASTTSMTISISGITFRNSSSGGAATLFFGDGWDASNSFKVDISDCVFDGGSSGIYLSGWNRVTNVFETIIKNSEFENTTQGVFGDYSSVFTVDNCLFYNNAVGILSDSSFPTITSCTIDHSSQGGIQLKGNNPSTVRDCIITNNLAGGIYVVSGSGTVTATYNNVWNNEFDYIGATAGVGSISQDPSYATGRLGAYYLGGSSPSVDKGSTSAASLGLDKMTTRTDERWDTGTVDMGYHYASNWLGKRGLPIEFILKILKGNKNN